MKLHLVLKLKPEVDFVEVPHWSVVIQIGISELHKFCPPIDAFFQRHEIPVFVTAEYQKGEGDWSQQDRDNGFDRVVRIVLLKNTKLSSQQLEDLKEIGQGRIVEYAYLGKVESAPIPVFSKAQGYPQTDAARKMIYLREAHEQFTKGHPDVIIAVLDTGIDLSHPELQDCLLSGHDFVDIIDGAGDFFGDHLGIDADANDEEVGHGTHVAGIIAAKGLRMPIGVAPNCKILPVRVLGALKQDRHFVGAGLVDNINNGIKWAIDQGASIINMSLGIRHSGGGLPHQDVVQYAKQKGVSIVAASGNDGTENLYYPSALPHVLSIGALGEARQVAPFSTRGRVSYTAPGTAIYSSYIENSYAHSSGTSQAAPFVAGLVALLKSYALEQGRKLTDPQIKYILKHTADRTGQSLHTQQAGYGSINAIDALQLLKHKI